MSRESSPPLNSFRLGSRGSDLALWQTNHVRHLLLAAWPGIQVAIEIFTTKGDQVLDTPLPLIGGKGLFTAELEAALKSGTIDAAVHSLKDLPTEYPAGITVGAVPARANPADVLVSKEGHTLSTLPEGAEVGTSSRRRASQLLSQRPDLNIVDIRGNVPTRIHKALAEGGPYNAIVLAHAGLERLGLLEVVGQILPLELMLPAPGQGALGIQCRDDQPSLELLSPLNHLETRTVVTAERSFLSGLGGGCSVPIAAYANLDGGRLSLVGRVAALDGSRQIDVQMSGSPSEAHELGLQLASASLAEGAAELLGKGA